MVRLHRKDLGLLALRVGTGGVLFAHGAQKLLGWFGGSGIEGTAQAMEAMGFRPGRPSAVAAGLGEAGGGLLLALGAVTPAAGAMAGAVAVHRPAGFFATQGGYEYPAYLGLVAAALGLSGVGRYSLDHLTRNRLDSPAVVALAFAASTAAAVAIVGRRERTLAAKAETEGTGEA
ncbi:DoxX family protein [Streptomyces thermodiastaticus]|uniref:DoxX family protein n=1 Tax=Streptomyces thermodiastaticus TaxID=44061 RepID=UPI00167706F8|nr:DoxX family protein [Streptomyces thermodiastaticus]MCE7552075.1 DoxX family protein [Streptomyces thermodiastaticus]GHF78129.1 RpiR family transcriptional regulator [Streptomyces thermodiastaticus]